MELSLIVEEGGAQLPKSFDVKSLVIAGWTGRNKAAMEAHIAELGEIGIARPKRMPEYYRNGANLLTNEPTIQVVGTHSSGEVEFVVYVDGDSENIYIGLGSDHTDRETEKSNVTISKQVCPKPVSAEVWRYDGICDHWESLILRSHAVIDGTRVLYQEGPVTTMKDPMELLEGFEATGGSRKGLVMFCGTLAVRGGVRPAQSFELELHDPIFDRSIKHTYSISEFELGE